jgi:hypothetical protein
MHGFWPFSIIVYVLIILHSTNALRIVAKLAATSQHRNHLPLPSTGALSSSETAYVTGSNSRLTDSRLKIWLSATKTELKKHGAGAFLSYSCVSNISTVTCLAIAWISHCKLFHVSPLSPGRWKAYLLMYAGIYGANNALRPLRITLAVALAPVFTSLIRAVQNGLRLGRKQALFVSIFLVNVVGTLTYLSAAILAAARITGVPIWPLKIL